MHNGQAISTVPFVVPMSNLGFQYGPMMQQFIAQPGGGTSAAAAAAAAVVAGPPPMAKLRVTVHVNGMLKGGMALMLPNTLEQFYEMAKRKLQFEGELFRRVFTRSGGEISCLDEMCQDDMLWLSTGEDFVTPR